jgi:hypothetical protein
MIDTALGEYIPSAPISDEARKHNQNLPGMGEYKGTINFNPSESGKRPFYPS